VLQLARDCTSSVIGLADRLSILSDNTNALSIQFDFDPVLLGSQVYQVAHRSNVKQIIRAGRQHDQASISTDIQPNIGAQSAPDAGLDPQPQTLRPPGEHQASNFDDSNPTPPRILHRRGNSDQTFTTTNSESGTKDALRGMFRVPALASLRRSKSQRYPKTQAGEFLQSNTASVKHAPQRKVMLLGTSESGKSTLLKVLKLYHNVFFSSKELAAFTETIFTNIIQATRAILDAMESLGMFLEDDRKYFDAHTIQLQPSLVDALTEETELAIASLWDDAGFKEAYRCRFKYQLNVNAKSLADDIHCFATQDFVPTIWHALKSYVATIDIVQTSWNEKDYSLSVFDLGGLRSQRRKWMRVAENTSTVLFTVDTTAYCKLLYEAENVNRMEEQLILFESIANHECFRETSIILVMTHIDLLEETMKLAPVQNWRSDLPTQSESQTVTMKEYLSYLYGLFASQMKDEEKRKGLEVIYTDLVHSNIQILGEAIMKVVI
jgi:guanine nucleotide-binding protein subunit alpha